MQKTTSVATSCEFKFHFKKVINLEVAEKLKHSLPLMHQHQKWQCLSHKLSFFATLSNFQEKEKSQEVATTIENIFLELCECLK